MKTCQWKIQEPDIDDETYEAGCGEVWVFLSGGPSDNGAKFCMFCGGRIEVMK